MSVDQSQVAGIAALARLRFGDEELRHITQELNQVLDYVEVLKSLEVDDQPQEGLDPLGGEGVVTRGPGADTPDALVGGFGALSPDARDGFFVVPPLPGVQAGGGE
jgi:Asp-tRNA(Asn)/Glu-tRNA(Gln) amidotransferase C subunit